MKHRMNLQLLHEQFIEMSNRPMSFGSLPVPVREPDAPIMAVERWREVNGALYKTYRFRRLNDRKDFVTQLLAYESVVEHPAQITIDDDIVSIKVQTRSIKKVTELDREYARYADVLFKGMVYHNDD